MKVKNILKFLFLSTLCVGGFCTYHCAVSGDSEDEFTFGEDKAVDDQWVKGAFERVDASKDGVHDISDLQGDGGKHNEEEISCDRDRCKEVQELESPDKLEQGQGFVVFIKDDPEKTGVPLYFPYLIRKMPDGSVKVFGERPGSVHFDKSLDEIFTEEQKDKAVDVFGAEDELVKDLRRKTKDKVVAGDHFFDKVKFSIDSLRKPMSDDEHAEAVLCALKDPGEVSLFTDSGAQDSLFVRKLFIPAFVVSALFLTRFLIELKRVEQSGEGEMSALQILKVTARRMWRRSPFFTKTSIILLSSSAFLLWFNRVF
ncbi:hypothetical protein ACFLY6_02695 [Candidatus Dependentiae bacterium]